MATATSENILLKTVFLSILMIFLGISAATSGLNESDPTEFIDQNEVRNVILPLAQLNQPGFQEGSIFTDTTLSSGGTFTCAILDNGSVSCWGFNNYGQLGNGGTTSSSIPTLTSSLGAGRTAVALSSGAAHTCAILDNGSVSCWGANYFGQLGNGGLSNPGAFTATPTLTSSLGAGRTAVALSSGSYHTCAILDNGSVSCWGSGDYGQLGDGRTSDASTPTLTSSLPAGRTAVAISSGYSHTCALLDNGSVSCWGRGDYGQLGGGGTSDQTTPTHTSSLGTGRTAVALTSGYEHTCAILDNGSVSCWGRGDAGQLGDGGTSNQTTPTLTGSLGIGRTAVAISSGPWHTCSILDNGAVACWGYGDYGQLGNGGTSTQRTPTLTGSLGSGRTAVAIVAGDEHTCAILDNGSVTCWGYNNYGQLGNGGTTSSTIPTLTSSLGAGRTVSLSERDLDGDGTNMIFQTNLNLDYRERMLSSGDPHTCVILDNGSVSCWGYNSDGQLGNGGTTSSSTPTLTSSLGVGRTAVEISSGGYSSCAILDNGSVVCWGRGVGGQLGYGGSSEKTTPTPTSSLGVGRSAVAISHGKGPTSTHVCVILDNGDVSCWGYGADGQIGNGGTTSSSTPTPTSNLGTGRTAVGLSSGGYHTCAVLDNGSVSCWGRGDNGQLGNGGTSDQTTPTLTSSLGTGRSAVAISSGMLHTCALLDNGSVSCWGDNDLGQLGNGGTTPSSAPTLTSSLGTGRRAIALSSGGYHTCAILDNGAVSCWGAGGRGQLGHGGSPTEQTTPTLTSSLGTGRTAIALSSGGYHTCAILDNGAVSCWGWGLHGQLGNGGGGSDVPTLTSSLGAGRTAMLVDGDQDNDGVYDHFDLAPTNPIRGVKCASGQFGRYLCVDAPQGKYVPSSGSMYATDAGAGHYVPSTGQTNQTACSPGTYQANVSQISCDNADAGYYVDQSGQSMQTACATGTYNPNTGSYSSSACADADAGYFVPSSGQASQTACAAGTYQAITGQSSCVAAEAGYYVSTTAQPSQTACALGTYQANTGQSSCDDADAGYYVDQTGQSSQTVCSAGTFQANTGQSSCDDADAGYYVPTQGQSSQTACSAGTYQANTGQSSCDDADAGYYVATTAQSSQTACSLGTYQDSVAQLSCIVADAGYYVDQTGQSVQSACPVGTYNPNFGQSSCNDADPGYFVSIEGQIRQTACAMGAYQPQSGQSSCEDAPAGYYVPTIAQTQPSPCGVGSYQSNTSQSSCEIAEAGYYVPTLGQMSQTACAPGTYQINTGQSSCDLAEAGYYVPTEAQTGQTPCAIGTYQSKTAQASCNLADSGYYVPNTGQTAQTACALGTYQPDVGQTSCVLADANHYVDQTGQANQTACPAGTTNQYTGSTTPTACASVDGDSVKSGMSAATGVAIGFLLIIPVVFVAIKRRATPFDPAVSSEPITQEPRIEDEIAPSVELSITSPAITGPPQGPPSLETTPPVDSTGIVGDDGYEWLEFPENSGRHFYRVPGGPSWEKWD
jgi:alpha-tubulin suppressor-like RCC1 family protein